MSRLPLWQRLLGRTAHEALWRLVCLALLWQIASPTRRELTRAALSPRQMSRVLQLDGVDQGDALAAARRVNRWYAWLATADRVNGEQRLECYDKALALAPNDAGVLVRRAAGCAVQPGSDGLPQLWKLDLDTALDATRGAPDNAAGWYLLAAAQMRAGHRQEALAALTRGNQATRYDDGTTTAMRAQARSMHDRGVPQLESWLATMPATLLPHMAAFRGLARSVVQPDGSPDERLQVAAMGARVRDSSTLVIGTLVGMAVEQIAFAGPQTSKASTEKLSEEQRAAKRQAQAEAFAGQLRAAGQSAQADWVMGEQRRLAAAHQAKRNMGWLTAFHRALGPGLIRYLTCALWIFLALTAAFLTLAAGLPVRLSQPRLNLPWRLRDLVTAWCVTLVPFTILSAALSRTLAGMFIAAVVGPGSNASQHAPQLMLLWMSTMALPALLSVAIVRFLARAYARRQFAGDAEEQRRFARGTRCALLLPSAALLLLGCVAAEALAIGQRTSLVRIFEGPGYNEAAGMVEVMDRAAPARPLPR